MSIFDDIRRDREAGTPGPWEVKYQDETHLYMNGDSQMCDMTYYPWVPDKTADWERIARVPDLERIALAAEELLKECDRIAPIVGEAIWERIARVPELERIALAAEELAKVFPEIVGYLEGLIEDGCPQCGGDCSGANPPPAYCTMRFMRNHLSEANDALAKLREATA